MSHNPKKKETKNKYVMETRALGMLFVMLRHFLLIKGKNINAVKLNVRARNKSNALINNEVMKVSMMEVFCGKPWFFCQSNQASMV